MIVLCKFGQLVNILTLLSLYSVLDRVSLDPCTFAKGELIGKRLGIAEQ